VNIHNRLISNCELAALDFFPFRLARTLHCTIRHRAQRLWCLQKVCHPGAAERPTTRNGAVQPQTCEKISPNSQDLCQAMASRIAIRIGNEDSTNKQQSIDRYKHAPASTRSNNTAKANDVIRRTLAADVPRSFGVSAVVRLKCRVRLWRRNSRATKGTTRCRRHARRLRPGTANVIVQPSIGPVDPHLLARSSMLERSAVDRSSQSE